MRPVADIFEAHPTVTVIEVVDYEDGGLFGVSEGGTKLKIWNDEGVARRLSDLPGAMTKEGHVTDEGFRVRAGYNSQYGGYSATVLKHS